MFPLRADVPTAPRVRRPVARDPQDWVLAEVERLREWRHDVVTPQLAALNHRFEYLSSLVERINIQVSEFDHKLDQIAKRDEIEAAVRDATREAVAKERQHWTERLTLPWRILTYGLGIAVAGAAIGSFILNLIH